MKIQSDSTSAVRLNTVTVVSITVSYFKSYICFPHVFMFAIIAAYVTEEGKTKVNMFFKSSEMIQITKIRIKVGDLLVLYILIELSLSVHLFVLPLCLCLCGHQFIFFLSFLHLVINLVSCKNIY